MTMEFRRIFDTIPEQFDRYRVHYGTELYKHFICQAGMAANSKVLELGPGTGQATDPILATGCDYYGIEIGDNFAAVLQRKYGSCVNFSLIHDDFITHDFGDMRFDVIYSASTIPWIPEEVAFPKTFALLKPGGMLGMIMLRASYRESNEALYNRIQEVYSAYFKPQQEYNSRKYVYENALKYGYVEFKKYAFHGQRVLTADDYIGYCGTHSDHLTVPEPYRSKFFQGLHDAVIAFGNRIVFDDVYVLMTVQKPF